MDKKLEFKNDVDNIILSIMNYIEGLPDDISDKHIIDIHDKFLWIRDYFEILNNKECCHENQVPFLSRGDIILLKAGENLGMEFSGQHPAIVLRNAKENSDQVLVLPLTSKKPKAYDPNNKNIYIEFKKIIGMSGYQNPYNVNDKDNGKHWCNILNIRNISKSRIVFPPEPKKLDGDDLTEISATIVSQIALIRNKMK